MSVVACRSQGVPTQPGFSSARQTPAGAAPAAAARTLGLPSKAVQPCTRFAPLHPGTPWLCCCSRCDDDMGDLGDGTVPEDFRLLQVGRNPLRQGQPPRSGAAGGRCVAPRRQRLLCGGPCGGAY